MTDDTITLVLHGEIPFPAFRKAVDGFQDLVVALGDCVAHNARIDWVVTDLEVASSAIATVTGAPIEGAGYDAVHSVVRAYEDVGELLRRGGSLDRYPLAVEKSARRIIGVLNGRVSSVRFETEQKEAEVTSAAMHARATAGEQPQALAVAMPETAVSYGTVRGRVQSLTSRGRLRFTLYDINADRAVSCYLEPGSEDLMRETWGKMALVGGIVRRDPVTGQAMTVRQVTTVAILPEAEPGSWRRAIGAIPYVHGVISAEAAVRRGRDE